LQKIFSIHNEVTMDTENSSNDGIRIIDIIRTLIIRRWWFAWIFSSVFIIFLIFAYRKPVTKLENASQLKYTTYFFVGNMHLNYPLEPLTIIDIKIREIYLREMSQDIPIEIDYDVPKNGNIMRLNTFIPNIGNAEETDSKIREFHSQLLKPILEEHDQIFESIKLENSKNMDKKGSPFIRRSKIMRLAQKTSFSTAIIPTGQLKISSMMIIVAGFCMGLLMGVVGVFLIEFLLQIKKSLKDLGS